MQKFIGKLEDFLEDQSTTDECFWADYQVLGSMFSALRIFMAMDDVLTVIVGAKGCAYHLNFSVVAWGEIDFFLGKRPLPVLEVDQVQTVIGDIRPPQAWMDSLVRLVHKKNYQRIMLLPTDSILISGTDLGPLSRAIQEAAGVEATPLPVSAISSPNQWAGYDAALKALYGPYLNREYRQTKSVNLVGWMWPSRHRGHEIGCCIAMLEELGIPLNTVVSGGSRLADIETSMTAAANAVVCSSVMGEMLDLLDKKGIKLAGPRAPYGFSGTREWLTSIADALDMDVSAGIDAMEEWYREAFEANKRTLKGKKVFVSGGPGRLIGLLHTLIDYEADIRVAAMFWPHEWSKSDIRHMLEQHNLKVDTFLLSAGLDDLERVAREHDFDVWLGGYQEQHTCKRHGIPFVPITVYQVPHVGFEGAVNLGNKLIMALNGHSFTDSVFFANDIGGVVCPPAN